MTVHVRTHSQGPAARTRQVSGVQALVEQHWVPRGPHPNRVNAEIEARILAYGHDHPRTVRRLANQLRLERGLTVSPSGVRGDWLRHLETRNDAPPPPRTGRRAGHDPRPHR